MIRSSSKSVVIFASYDFVNRDLRAVFTPLDMLTYLFCLLSKPNSPIKEVTFLLIFISLLPTFLNQRFDSATKIHHFKEMLHIQVFLILLCTETGASTPYIQNSQLKTRHSYFIFLLDVGINYTFV